MADSKTDLTVIDNVLNICTAVVMQAFVTAARNKAEYVRKLATHARGINISGNLSMYRKNLGIAEEMDSIAFDIQHNALFEPQPARYIERATKRAHDLAAQTVRPRV
jgi:hypothetical protein